MPCNTTQKKKPGKPGSFLDPDKNGSIDYIDLTSEKSRMYLTLFAIVLSFLALIKK